MNKISLIIKREYLSRIRNKTFLLSTLLTPLLIVGLIFFSTWMAVKNSEKLTIGVYDESGFFASRLQKGDNIDYSPVGSQLYDSLVQGKEVSGFNGVLHIPVVDIQKPAGIEYVSGKQLGIFSQSQVERDVNEVLKKERMVRANIDTAQLSEISKNPISLSQKIVSEDSEGQQANSGISYAVGYASGILIYFVLFIYGTMVMRGVMEEKVNRIAEVMVSSVKPFELMMGKILGIGAVGITQFLIWIVLIVIGMAVLGGTMDLSQMEQTARMPQTGGQEALGAMNVVNSALGQLNLPLLLGAFLFYFIGGYLFYAALFAAVGSAVNEDPQDAQAMMLPITMPIIFSMVTMMSAVANPTGPLAVWCSIIPFTSPITMMARLPFGVPGTVPYWQLGLSAICLLGGFLLTTWLSARIYRTGILLYGKKAGWKELMVWAFRKA